jgi:ankyrin repeat protein
VIKSMICKSREYLSSGSNPRKASIARHTKALVFIGTPHRGADSIKWAGIANKMASIFQKTTLVDENNRLVTALSKGSDLLEDLQERFSRWIDRFAIKTILEGKEYGNLGKIVDKETATLGVKNEDIIHIPANHSDMCKFASDTDIGYQRISDALLQLVEDMTAEVEQSKKVPDAQVRGRELDPLYAEPGQPPFELDPAELSYRTAPPQVNPEEDITEAAATAVELDSIQGTHELEGAAAAEDGIQPSPISFSMYADLVEKYTDRIKVPTDEHQAGLSRLRSFREQNSDTSFGVNVNEAPSYRALMAGFNENSRLSQARALYFAAFLGHEPIVDRLLQAGVDPNVTPDFESDAVHLTPLTAAVIMHEDETVGILLEHGVDLTLCKCNDEALRDPGPGNEDQDDVDDQDDQNDQENLDGEELGEPEESAEVQDVEELGEPEESAEVQDGEAAEEETEEATEEGEVAESEDGGGEGSETEDGEAYDVNDQVNISTEALILAATYGTANSTSLILEYCSTHDVPPIVHEGIGILQTVVNEGEAATLEILIRHGFPVDEGDDDGTTALHYACQKGYIEEATILLRQGANPNMQDGGSRTALHYAVSSDNIEMLNLILRWDSPAVDLEALDEDGDPALQYAVVDPAKEKMVDALLAKGASLKHQNQAGKTLTQQAEEVEGNDAIERIIAVSVMGVTGS